MMTACVGCLPAGGRGRVGGLCVHRGTERSAASQPSWATSLQPFSSSGKGWVFRVTLWQRWTLQAEWPVSLFSADTEPCHSRHWRSFPEVVWPASGFIRPEGPPWTEAVPPGNYRGPHAAARPPQRAWSRGLISESWASLFCSASRPEETPGASPSSDAIK